MSVSSRSPTEDSPLLCDVPPSYRTLSITSDDVSLSPTVSEPDPLPPNTFSTSDKTWILAGLWTGVFLGALDGASFLVLHWYIPFNRDSCEQELLWPRYSLRSAATSASPIRLHILGPRTSFLFAASRHYTVRTGGFFCVDTSNSPYAGRLSDIIGRKGAMLTALSLFGILRVIPCYLMIVTFSQVQGRFAVG